MPKKLTYSYDKKVAQPPGSLVHVGATHADTAEITLITFSPEQHRRIALDGLEGAVSQVGPGKVTWLNISGLHDTALLEEAGRLFSIHPLTLEDILNTNQRPKVDFFDGYVYFVLKMIRPDAAGTGLDMEQVSLVLGPDWVLTFQERPGDVLDSLRQRIEGAKGRIRETGSDYLFYAIMDVIVDHYFVSLESIGEVIESLENRALDRPDPTLVSELQRVKREMLFLRKAIWPLREQIASLLREGHPLVQKSTEPYLRDLYDHTVQIIDTVETFRDMTSGLLDVYLSSLSNRMNEVMKVLTVISTIFIPLTFIAGIYGMNFQYMPELHFPWAYPVILGTCLAIAGGMVVYFRRKHWL